jgi:hypothetical protein
MVSQNFENCANNPYNSEGPAAGDRAILMQEVIEQPFCVGRSFWNLSLNTIASKNNMGNLEFLGKLLA